MKTVHFNERDPINIARAIRHLIEGRSNAAGQATLRANQTTTTVTSDVIPAGCFPQLTPASATAAAEWGGGSIYVSSVAKGAFVITHSNTADADKLVNWFAVGG